MILERVGMKVWQENILKEIAKEVRELREGKRRVVVEYVLEDLPCFVSFKRKEKKA